MKQQRQPTDSYPSRTGENESILPRKDPVIYEDKSPPSPYKLSRESLRRYADDGFLILPGYMKDLVAPLKREIDILRSRLEGAEELYTEPDSNELRTLFKPFAFSELVERISRDPRILHPVQQMLGSAVYPMQSRINVKPAFAGRSFPWHSDFETWHVEDGMPGMRAVTAWIMLSDNTPHNGPLYVLKGSHKKFVSCAGKTGKDNFRTSLKKQTLGVPRNETMQKLTEEHELTGIYGEPGTLVFHECNIMHGSPDNISGDARSLLMFVYNSVENKAVRPFGGIEPRPHYLNNRDRTPLQPLDAPVAARHFARYPGAGENDDCYDDHGQLRGQKASYPSH